MEALNCVIKTLEKEDVPECIRILDAALGKDYIESNKLLSMITDDKFICLKALVCNQLVGVHIGCIMNLSEAIDYLKLTTHKIPAIMKKNNKIAILKTCAVKEEFQRKGIGDLFIKVSEKMFLEKNIHLVSCVAWQHDGIENAGPLLRKNGYKSLFVIKDYWTEDSLREGFSCPVCGDHGCHCAANIYLKEIHFK